MTDPAHSQVQPPPLFTYADYCTWPDDQRYELVEGVVYTVDSSPAIRGAPDWVVEVLSPATASRDHIVKRRIYEAAGVREYWLVHPEDRILMIYRLEHGVYGKPNVQALTGETPVGILPEILIQWDEPE